MFVHLWKVKQPVRARNWLICFYLGLAGWQFENVVRYGFPIEYYSTTAYSLQTIFIYIPCLSLALLSHTQYTYQFLVPCFKREQKIAFWAIAVLSFCEVSLVVWNELFNNGNLVVLLLSCFAFSLPVTSWNIILSIRKARHLRNWTGNASKAHWNLAVFNTFFVGASVFSLLFGFFSAPGFWSYFLFVWFGTLASIVLYIVTAAVPASFQVKVTGFVFVLAATILCVITLAYYPPVMLTDMPGRLAQQKGLINMMGIIFIVALIIVTLLPYMLKISFTRRLQHLLFGVRAVNAGNLETRVQVGLRDELGVLTQNFNQMTHSLKKAQHELTVYAQTLEKRVAERTAQLEQSLKELKDAQAQLVLREKMASLGDLTAGIAHEIQNPLNFVNNFSEINAELIMELKAVLSMEKLPEQSQQYIDVIISDAIENLKKIKHHGKRADAIVKSMLQHSQSHSGEKEWIDLNLLADKYLKLAYHGTRSKDKSFVAYLKTEFDDNLDKAEVITQDIGRVFLNLFNNAFYSISKKRALGKEGYEPTVCVSTKKVQNGILVKVRDNGVGIEAKDLDKIFQPFFTTKPAGEGTGLGLSLTYDIITKGHGGELTVNTAEGEFAEFSLLLPVKASSKERKMDVLAEMEK